MVAGLRRDYTFSHQNEVRVERLYIISAEDQFHLPTVSACIHQIQNIISYRTSFRPPKYRVPPHIALHQTVIEQVRAASLCAKF